MNIADGLKGFADSLRGFKFDLPTIDKIEPPVYELGDMPTVHEETNERLDNISKDQKDLLTQVINSLNSLNQTIQTSDTKNEKLGNKMYWLSWGMVALAAAQVVVALVK